MEYIKVVFWPEMQPGNGPDRARETLSRYAVDVSVVDQGRAFAVLSFKWTGEDRDRPVAGSALFNAGFFPDQDFDPSAYKD